MSKKKTIVLSFDYELFFGDRSGTVQKTLIEPTNLLLDEMDSVGFKGNFFVDYLMLKYLALESDKQCKKDYDAIINQLKDMVRRGHRIELHIHPHWVDAKYNGNGTWNYDNFNHYGLNAFSYNEITTMFEEGTRILENIAHTVDPSYKVIAFRAGGWAIQPFEMVREGFERTGIMIDSSVSSGVYIDKDNTIVDFTKAPVKSSYHFSSDVCQEEPNGKFIEVPISAYYRDLFTSALTFISNKLAKGQARIPDGTHNRAADEYQQTTAGAMERQKMPAMFSLDNQPLRTKIKIKAFQDDLMCFIDHPKDFNGYTLKNIRMVAKCGVCETYASLLKRGIL